MTVDLDEFFRETLVPWAHGILEAQDYLDELESGKVPGWRLGLSSLDKYVRFVPREFVVIGARSGTGKTALGMQLVENVARQMIAAGDNGLIAVFSAEMDSRTLALRTACGLEGVGLWALQSGKATKEEIARVRACLGSMVQWPFVVDQSSAPTLEHMVEQLAIYASDRPIRMVLFDYLELSGEMDKSESLRIAKVSRGLKAIAKHFDTTVLGIAQMNRDIESRIKKRPMMSDLMQGGEREPDRIILLVRESMFEDGDAGPDDADVVKVYIVKNRNAPPADVALLFDGQRMRFRSAVIDEQEIDERIDEGKRYD